MTAAALVALTLVYLLTVGSWTVWDAALGAVMAALLLAAFHRFTVAPASRGPRHGVLRASPRVLLLAFAIAREFGVGTVRTVRALASRDRRPGFVDVPFEERSDSAIALTGFLATLAPDEYLVDVDWETRTLRFHVIDARDPDEIRRRHDALYRRYVAPLFE